MSDLEKVCPRCGSSAGGGVFCSSCGLNLPQQGDLPTAEAYAAREREQAWLAEQEAQQRATRESTRRQPQQDERDPRPEDDEAPSTPALASGDQVERWTDESPGVGDEREVNEPNEHHRSAHGPSVAVDGIPSSSEDVRADTSTPRRRILAVGLALIILGAGAAVGGYLLGRTGGQDLDAARLAGERAGQREGTARGTQEGYETGFEAGRSEAATETGSGPESPVAPESPAGASSCSDVTITPNSGDFLFDVTAQGIDCAAAEELLLAWGRGSDGSQESPPGYTCEGQDVGNSEYRSTCTETSGDAVIEFTTGP